MTQTAATTQRTLLCTVTGEPIMPVRLYYRIPGRAAVRKVFEKLRCMYEDVGAGCWVWHYEREAAGLTFSTPREKLDPRVHPLVIGRVTLPAKEEMVLTVRSVARAVEAARFFGPRLGPEVVLARGRVINRWFEAREAAEGLDHIDALLDQNVTVIDPQDAEDRFEAAMAGTKTRAEKERALEAHYAERRKRDVPLVEDFPLHAEEETPEFRDLKFTLEMRMVRAHEHWKGSTATLADLIHRLVEGKLTPTK